eukprot:gene7780-1996_t
MQRLRHTRQAPGVACGQDAPRLRAPRPAPDRLLALAERFGWADVPGHPGVKVIRPFTHPGGGGGAGPRADDSWHTDGPPRARTSWVTFLLARDVPPHGRDTVFADMEAAYGRLSRPVREFLATLSARHSWGYAKPEAPPVTHPVVMRSPASGCGGRGSAGAIDHRTAREESDHLLEYLFRLTSVPELQLRVSWKPGTLTIWDNERTQHYLVRDREYDRVMHRVMVDTGA